MKHSLGNHQQVVAHDNPNLYVGSVARCSIERLDVQMSSYEFEERLHALTLTIKFCDSESRKTEVICDECVNIVCRMVLVNHHAYPFWITLRCLDSCEQNILITDDASTVVDSIIYIQTIVVFVIKFSRLLEKILGQVVVNMPVLGLIQSTKCGAWGKIKTGKVQLTLESRKGNLIGAKILLRSELYEVHHHELAGEIALMSVTIVPCDTLAEDVLWEQGHDLDEYIFTLIYLICSLNYCQMQSHV